jgi:carboxyl-terminal processing protease
MLQKSRTLFERNIFGLIIYNAKEMQDYMQYLNEGDPTVQRAIQVLMDGESYPKAPESEEKDSTNKKKDMAKGSLPEHLLLPVRHIYAVAPCSAGITHA